MKIIAFLCGLLIPSLLLGQKAIPIRVSFFNEATAIPFTKFFTTPIHPGVEMGSEITYKKTKKSSIFQTGNISYFYHRHLNQGIGLSTELGYQYMVIPKLKIGGLLGLGYMHTFATQDEFVFDNGQYKLKSDKGNARFFPSFSLIMDYQLNTSPKSPTIFLKYQGWVEYPYSPGFIPLMTHINLHLGTKFYIHFNQK